MPDRTSVSRRPDRTHNAIRTSRTGRSRSTNHLLDRRQHIDTCDRETVANSERAVDNNGAFKQTGIAPNAVDGRTGIIAGSQNAASKRSVSVDPRSFAGTGISGHTCSIGAIRESKDAACVGLADHANELTR